MREDVVPFLLLGIAGSLVLFAAFHCELCQEVSSRIGFIRGVIAVAAGFLPASGAGSSS